MRHLTKLTPRRLAVRSLLATTLITSLGCGGGSNSSPPSTPSPPSNNPAPAVSSLSATSAPAGWPGTPLLINGSDFVAASTMQWNGSNRPSTLLNSSTLKTAISIGDLAQPGTAPVTVFNPAPGGGTSSPTTFIIEPVAAGAVGVIERSSIATDLSEGNAHSTDASISADGRYIAFTSFATNLGGGSNPGNVFFRDTCVAAPTACTPSVSLISVSSQGNAAGGFNPFVSSTGRFVAFTSGATNLVSGDTNGFSDVFVRDTCVGGPSGCTPTTRMASFDNAGGQILLENTDPQISADGRFVAFASGMTQYYYTLGSIINLRDTCTGAPPGCSPTTSRIDVASGGVIANGDSFLPILSSNGRYVAFQSSATNLVTPNLSPPLPVFFVFLRDTCLGASSSCIPSTTLMSVDHLGAALYGGGAQLGGMSEDGRFVVFDSTNDNVVAGDTNGFSDVFVRDTCNGAPAGCVPVTIRVSRAQDGSDGNDHSYGAAIRVSPRFIAFNSFATNLVNGDSNNDTDIFLRDTCIGAGAGCTPSTVRLSLALNETQSDDESLVQGITIGGRHVVFVSKASTLAPSDTNATWDVFLARTNAP